MPVIKNIKQKSLHWEDQKVKIKIQFPYLTDADLAFDESEKSEMFEYLKVKFGMTKEHLQTIIETL